jgi:hypothetical protein
LNERKDFLSGVAGIDLHAMDAQRYRMRQRLQQGSVVVNKQNMRPVHALSPFFPTIRTKAVPSFQKGTFGGDFPQTLVLLTADKTASHLTCVLKWYGLRALPPFW